MGRNRFSSLEEALGTVVVLVVAQMNRPFEELKTSPHQVAEVYGLNEVEIQPEESYSWCSTQ